MATNENGQIGGSASCWARFEVHGFHLFAVQPTQRKAQRAQAHAVIEAVPGFSLAESWEWLKLARLNFSPPATSNL
jgi:hypothetical protein